MTDDTTDTDTATEYSSATDYRVYRFSGMCAWEVADSILFDSHEEAAAWARDEFDDTVFVGAPDPGAASGYFVVEHHTVTEAYQRADG